MRLLLIDNFDSFVYNLAQAFGVMGAQPIVVRSDAAIADLTAHDPDVVVISPGPGHPDDAGSSVDAVRTFAGNVPVLGVCLGHQCIASAFGGRVARSSAGPVHGKTSWVTHSGDPIFAGVPERFVATRYHSLAVEPDLPDALVAIAHSDDGTVMALRHRELPVVGVQFHPESVLTAEGPKLLANFLATATRT